MKYELDQIDESIVTLDTYNSDLNLVVDGSKYSAQPLTKEGFAFMWAGARASHGSDKGKFCFEMKVVEQLDVSHLPADEPNPHVVRIGFSVDSTSLQLGEDPLSYGYGGTGKISTNCQFKDFGPPFAAGDTILAAVNMESDPVQIGFAKNGNFLGWAYKVKKSDLRGKALFPHVLTKNCSFEVNLGQKEEPYFKLPDAVKDFTFIGCLPADKRVGGTRPPAKREDCEMIMMCGLPGAGKSVWAADYSSKNPEKKYNILGTNNIIDKMKVMGLPRKRNYAGRWDVLIQMATKCLNTMFAIGSKLRRNYVLDQTNVYPTAQRRKMRNFDGFKRKAIVIVPTEAEYKRRCDKRDREEGKEVPDSAVLEMKANFKIPEVNDIFDEVIFTEIQRDEAEKLVKKYNEEGKSATGPSRKQFRPNDPMKDRGFNAGKGNFKNEQDYQGGYGGNQGGFDNRSGYDSGYGGRDDFGMNRDSYGQRGGYDGGRGGRGGYDNNRGGRGSFDSGRGRGGFDSGRGGRGSFDNGRGGRGGFDSGRGGRGGYDSGRGGRGGYDSGRGGRGGYDSGYGERSDYESGMGSYGDMSGYESSRGGMSSYDSGRGRGSYDNGRGGRGGYDGGRGGRGGFDNNRGGRGGYDSGRGGRSDYDSRGGKSDYGTSSGDRGSYDSNRGSRGGYDNSRGSRGGYDSNRGSRGYDSSRGGRGSFDSSRGGRGGYDSSRGSRGSDNNRGGRGSYDNNRGGDRGGYDSYSSDTYKKDAYSTYGTSTGQAESSYSGSSSSYSGFNKTGQTGRDTYGSYSTGTGGGNASPSGYNYSSTPDKGYGNSSSDYNKGSTYSSYQRGGQGSRGGATGYYADESSQSRDTDYSAGQTATKDAQSGYYNKSYGYGSGSYDDYNKYGSTSDSYTSRTAASSYGSITQDAKSDPPKYSGTGTQDAAYPAAAPTRTTRWSAEIPKTDAPSVATYTSVTSQSYSQPAATSLPTQQMYGYQQGATANVASQWAGAAATPTMGQAAYAFPAQSTWSQYGQQPSTQYYSQ